MARVNDAIAQLSFALIDLLGDYSKVTSGKRSIADYSLEFIKDAYQGTLDYPEILAQSFNKDDFAPKSNCPCDFLCIAGNYL